MDSAMTETALQVIGEQAQPNSIMGLEGDGANQPGGYILSWSQGEATLLVYLHCGRSQVLFGTMRRLWVSLDNLRLYVSGQEDPDPQSVGSGGHFCIEFDDRRNGPVIGLKEALTEALKACQPA